MKLLGGKAGGIGIDGKWHSSDLRLKGINGEFEVLSQDAINALQTPFLSESFRLYSRWKLIKVLPHGGGTLDERESILEILEVLESEANGFDEWYRDHKDELIENTAGDK